MHKEAVQDSSIRILGHEKDLCGWYLFQFHKIFKIDMGLFLNRSYLPKVLCDWQAVLQAVRFSTAVRHRSTSLKGVLFIVGLPHTHKEVLQ